MRFTGDETDAEHRAMVGRTAAGRPVDEADLRTCLAASSDGELPDEDAGSRVEDAPDTKEDEKLRIAK